MKTKVENPVVERKRGWVTFDYGDMEVHIDISSWSKR